MKKVESPKKKPETLQQNDPVEELLKVNKIEEDILASVGIPGENRKHRAPIIFKNEPEHGRKIYFTHPGSSEPLKVATPYAVRVKPSGGTDGTTSSYTIEIFYVANSANFDDKFYENFRNRILVLESGVSEKGKAIGRRFGNLICTFEGMDTLPQYDENLRFKKFVCVSDFPLLDLDPVITNPAYFKSPKELAVFANRIKGIEYDWFKKK